MKKKFVITLLIASGLMGLVMVPLAFAEGAGLRERLANTPVGRFVVGRIGRGMVLRSELDATSEQREAIRGILLSHRPEIVAAARPIAEKRRVLRAAILAEVTDESAIRAASEDLASSIGDAAVLGATISAEIRGVLTPEQIEKIGQFISDNTQAMDELLDKLENQM